MTESCSITQLSRWGTVTRPWTIRISFLNNCYTVVCVSQLHYMTQEHLFIVRLNQKEGHLNHMLITWEVLPEQSGLSVLEYFDPSTEFRMNALLKMLYSMYDLLSHIAWTSWWWAALQLFTRHSESSGNWNSTLSPTFVSSRVSSRIGSTFIINGFSTIIDDIIIDINPKKELLQLYYQHHFDGIGDISICDNSNPTDISGLSNLRRIEGSLTILENPNINFQPLQNVVCRCLSILSFLARQQI